MAPNASPYASRQMGHRGFEHKPDEEKCVRALGRDLFDQNSLHCTLLVVSSCRFFWRGNVVCPIKEHKHPSHSKDPRADIFTHFQPFFAILLYFDTLTAEKARVCVTTEKINQTSREPPRASRSLRPLTSGLFLLLSVVRFLYREGVCSQPRATRSSQVTENSPVCALAEVLNLWRVSLPNKIITFIHGTVWTYVSLCKPFYTFCTFVLLSSIKIGLL